MPDPITIAGLHPGQPAGPLPKTTPTGPATTLDGKSFQDLLVESLNQVDRLQQEAVEGVEKVVTGKTENLNEVFNAVRKTDIAFSMLMEMRGKLMDAYRQLQQMQG